MGASHERCFDRWVGSPALLCRRPTFPISFLHGLLSPLRPSSTSLAHMGQTPNAGHAGVPTVLPDSHLRSGLCLSCPLATRITARSLPRSPVPMVASALVSLDSVSPRCCCYLQSLLKGPCRPTGLCPPHTSPVGHGKAACMGQALASGPGASHTSPCLNSPHNLLLLPFYR